EVSSMAAAFVTSILLQTVFGLDSDNPIQFAWLILLTVAVTTVVWVAVTFTTAPESSATLAEFYRRVRPSATGWQPVGRLVPEVKPEHDLLRNLMDWLLGCVLIYSTLFGIGKVVLQEYRAGFGFLAAGAAAAAVIYWDLARRGWNVVME